MNFPPISINKDIAIARTLPSYYYTENYFYNLSIEKIFKNSWQIITEKIKSEKITPIIFLKDSINESNKVIHERIDKVKESIDEHRQMSLEHHFKQNRILIKIMLQIAFATMYL